MRKFQTAHSLCGEVFVETEHLSNGHKAIIFEQDSDLVSIDFDEIDDLIEFLQGEQERLR